MSNFIDPTLLGRSSAVAAPQQQQQQLNGDGPTTTEEVVMAEAGPSDAPQTQEMHQKDQSASLTTPFLPLIAHDPSCQGTRPIPAPARRLRPADPGPRHLVLPRTGRVPVRGPEGQAPARPGLPEVRRRHRPGRVQLRPDEGGTGARRRESWGRRRTGCGGGSGRWSGSLEKGAPGRACPSAPSLKTLPTAQDRAKTTLTQEDLAQALAEFGINASRAPYYL